MANCSSKALFCGFCLAASYLDGATINNCRFTLASGRGIYAHGCSNSTISDCTIEMEDGIGVFLNGGSGAISGVDVNLSAATSSGAGIAVGAADDVDVTGCLVTCSDTRAGAGISETADAGTISKCTVDNADYGIYYTLPTVTHCIVTRAHTSGFYRPGGGTSVVDCITYANDGTNYYPASATSYVEDPLFCDASNREFTLRVDSRGNPENADNPNSEQIGAFPVACMYGTLVRDADYEEGGTLDFPGDLTVPSGKTLTLGAATTVKAGPGDSEAGGADTTLTELVVDGTLDVTGTSADGVTFDSGASPRGEGDWYGLYAGDGSTMNLAYATVKYAETGAAYDDADGGIVRHCTFSNNENLDLVVGVYSSSSVEVDTCTVDVGGGSGIQLTNDGSGVNLIGNSVYGGFSSARGIYGLLDSGTGTASGNSVSGFVFGSAIGIHSGGMTFVKNNVYGSKYGFEVTGGTAVLGDTTDSGSDNLAHGNTDGLYCTGAGAAPTVRESQFYSNSVGVLARSSASPDLGNSAHHGYNSFYSNTSYCVRNTTSGTAVDALGDWWGSCSAPTCTSGPVLTLLWLCSQPASVEEPIARVDDGRPGFRVMGAAPNPTAGAGRILFHLDGAPSRVRAQVFDVAGRLVRSLGPEEFPAGDHALTWDGRDRSGRPVGEGLYFVRVQAGSEPAATTKILVVR